MLAMRKPTAKSPLGLPAMAWLWQSWQPSAPSPSEQSGRDDSAPVISCSTAPLAALADSLAGAVVPVDGAAEAEPQQANGQDHVRPGDSAGSYVVTAPGGRTVDT